MKKTDNKYFYTAELMNEALIQLLEKKDLEFISVTEITKKAGVNRSTFYLHYDNMYELLEETIDNLNKKFVECFPVKSIENMDKKENVILVTEEYLLPYLTFCKENQKVLKLAHKKPNILGKDKAYKKMYDKILYPAISMFVTGEDERKYQLEFFTGGVVAIINKWFEDGCITEIDTLIAIIKSCCQNKG